MNSGVRVACKSLCESPPSTDIAQIICNARAAHYCLLPASPEPGVVLVSRHVFS